MDVSLVADVNERESGIPTALRALGAAVELACFPPATIRSQPSTLVERRSVLDLHGAVLKGRFWRQLGKLRAEAAATPEQRIRLRRSNDRDDTAVWFASPSAPSAPAGEPIAPYTRSALGGPPARFLMLAAIPGISTARARALLEQFGRVGEAAFEAMSSPNHLAWSWASE